MSQPGEEDSDGDGRGDENLPRAAWVEKGFESDSIITMTFIPAGLALQCPCPLLPRVRR